MKTESLERSNPKLKELHEQENAMSLEMSYIDKQITFLQKEKAKLQKRISGNMMYCNRLLNSTNNH